MIELHASTLNRVIACNGSIQMGGASVPPETDETQDRREGIAAHHVAVAVLQGHMSETIEYIDRKTPNGIYVTVEMAEFVEPFVTDVLSRNLDPFIEVPVDFDVSPTVRILARPDVITYDPETETLDVDDFKYGWRLVEPNNWTLIAYAIGWCISNGIRPARIRLNIHQPRPYHEDGKKRTLELDYRDLFTRASELTGKLANLTNHLNTGPHCYKCPALAKCPAARAAGMNSIEASNVVFSDELDNEAVAFEILNLSRAIEMAKQRKDALEELLTHRLKSGQVLQDWSLETGYGNYAWLPEIKATVAATIKAMTGVNVTKSDVMTPAQAIKAGASETIVRSFSKRPVTGTKLVHKSASKKAEKAFGKPNQ